MLREHDELLGEGDMASLMAAGAAGQRVVDFQVTQGVIAFLQYLLAR